jgi:hypothetical protein
MLAEAALVGMTKVLTEERVAAAEAALAAMEAVLSRPTECLDILVLQTRAEEAVALVLVFRASKR